MLISRYFTFVSCEAVVLGTVGAFVNVSSAEIVDFSRANRPPGKRLCVVFQKIISSALWLVFFRVPRSRWYVCACVHLVSMFYICTHGRLFLCILLSVCTRTDRLH